MTRKSLIASALIIGLVLLPALATAASPVSRLKDPTTRHGDADGILEQILNQGAGAVPELTTLAGQETSGQDYATTVRNGRARATAIMLLGDMNAQQALPVLTKILRTSTDISAITNAARAIGRMGGYQAYKALIDTLAMVNASPDALAADRKKAAIMGLGLCGEKAAVNVLLAELNNAKNTLLVRIYAAGSLGLLGNKSGLALATSGLDSADPAVIMASIRALGVIGSSSSIADLTPFTAKQEARTFREAAMLAITQIKAAALPADQKAAFIKQELTRNFGASSYIHWGTGALKRMKTAEAKKALESMSGLTAPDFQKLRRAARLRMKATR
ncbi:MAG: HEAT repeat domain-containing protein [Deltaproteobacteria bacterium]|nr:HEAT repeat domain-containing protein [Deltaproteobacteria bacterium]